MSSNHIVHTPISASYSNPTEIIAVFDSGLDSATRTNFHVSAVNAGTSALSSGDAQFAVLSRCIFILPADVATVDLIQNSI